MRHAMRAIMAATLLLAVILAGCAGDEREVVQIAWGDMACQPVDAARDGSELNCDTSRLRYTEHHVLTFHSQAEWQTFWGVHTGNASSPAPANDFGDRFIIALFAPERPTGGYGLLVNNVQWDGHDYLLDFLTLTPGDGCSTVQLLTQPHAFVSAEIRHDGTFGVDIGEEAVVEWPCNL